LAARELIKAMRMLRRILPVAIKRQIRPLAALLRPREPIPSVVATLGYLKQWGFNPETIVDVGAYHGEWTKMVKGVFPSAKVLMVEAQETKTDILNAVCAHYGATVTFELALLGSLDGKAVEFVEMETGSSVLEEQSPYPRVKVVKRTTTLDTLIRRSCKWDKIDLLKIDVQGYELQVLFGAMTILENCDFVLLEASLIPINRGCPLIADVTAFMQKNGFRIFDFCSQSRRKDGALWQTDLMFISERSAFLPIAGLTADNW
jgi:FkbM family methyltransferase